MGLSIKNISFLKRDFFVKKVAIISLDNFDEIFIWDNHSQLLKEPQKQWNKTRTKFSLQIKK